MSTLRRTTVGTIRVVRGAALQAQVVAVTAAVMVPGTMAAALGGPVIIIRAAAAASGIFANIADAISAPGRTPVPASRAITVVAPVPHQGIVAVARDHMPVVDVPAPDDADIDRAFDSDLMVSTIHPVGSFFWAPCRVGPGVFEDLQLQ